MYYCAGHMNLSLYLAVMTVQYFIQFTMLNPRGETLQCGHDMMCIAIRIFTSNLDYEYFRGKASCRRVRSSYFYE